MYEHLKNCRHPKLCTGAFDVFVPEHVNFKVKTAFSRDGQHDSETTDLSIYEISNIWSSILPKSSTCSGIVVVATFFP